MQLLEMRVAESHALPTLLVKILVPHINVSVLLATDRLEHNSQQFVTVSYS